MEAGVAVRAVAAADSEGGSRVAEEEEVAVE